MIELRNKIFAFRDILDLPPYDASASINQIVLGLIQDLKNLYPEIIPSKQLSEIGHTPIEKCLACLSENLKSIGEFWMVNDDRLMLKFKHETTPYFDENADSEKLAKFPLSLLDVIIKMAKERFDIMDEEVKDYLSKTDTFKRITIDSSPATPTSVLPEISQNNDTEFSYTSPLLMTLRVQAVRNLNPINVNHLGLQFSHTETPPDFSALKTEQKTEEVYDFKKVDQVANKDESKKMDRTDLIPQPPPFSPPTIHQNQYQDRKPPPPTPPPISQLPKTSHFNSTPPPAPPPPPGSLKTSMPPPPPPPMARGIGGAPPPPPPGGGAGRALRPKKANTKLKRSTQLGNLYRALKGKVEGSALLDGKSSHGRKGGLGTNSNAGGKQGMADALKEMTKRSAYFQQIEEDVRKYTKPINEIRISISSFKTKDMDELLKFHKGVESVLEHLTDESQVLSRFEEFPTKKLEALRTAAALHRKLDKIVNELRSWKIESPIDQLLDKVERYFNKIKGDMDTIERTKDEESKKFRSHNIEFDFNILIQIKEAMVDVSSSCMEMAIKDKRETKSEEKKLEKITKTDKSMKCNGKMLWRAFQLAFRVYTFAGGHDDRADILTRELAQEIESNSDP